MAKSKKNRKNQTPVKQNSKPQYEVAGFGRRFGALIYDLLLLIGVWLSTTLLFVTIFGLFNGGQGPESSTLLQITLFPLLLLNTFVFYGWFWTHGGKTLGMQAWRIRAVTENGHQMTWLSAFKRAFFAAPLMLLGAIGLLWVLINRENNALHDLLSNTRVVHIPKNS